MATKRDFTDRFLKAIKPAEPGKRVIYWDAVVPQFGIRVDDKSSSENVGSFVLVARFPGSSNPAPRRIGFYSAKARDTDTDKMPVGGRMSLAQAREIAREWRNDIANGIDPKHKEADRKLQEARRRADTFGAAFEAFDAERLSRLRTGGEVKKAIERYALRKWQSTPIREIRRSDIKELVREVHKFAPIASNRLLAYLKTFFAWAADEELVEASPAAAVKPLADEVRRDRVLADLEIRAIWEACDELGAFGRAFRLMLATGQRRTEVGEMTTREIDQAQRLWTIPRERTKADRGHEIPLSDLALSIVEDRQKLGDFVFSNDGTRPISGWSHGKRALDEKAKIADWRLHDLRRTCATNLARLGVDRVVISKLLNHSEGGVTQIYDRHSRDMEKRAAMELWGRRLQAIIDGTEGGNVVPISAARG